jgi:hypothetical protein
MKPNGLAWAVGWMLVATTCTAGSGVGPSDGAATGDVGAMAGAAGGTEGAAAGGAGGSSCPCGGVLSVDLAGDGDPLHLTSADYVAGVQSRLPVADLTMTSTSFTAVPACLAEPRPWAESLDGGFMRIYWVQACAGPGGAPPCIWLNPSSSWGSLYVDRAGHEILGNGETFGSSYRGIDTPLGEAVEGTFSMTLEDGRTLTASFRVCLLATFVTA